MNFLSQEEEEKRELFLSVSLLRASERRPDIARSVGINNILDTGVGAASQNRDSDDKAKSIESRESHVLLVGIPLALLDEQEPEQSWEVEGEA
jgi:hypothetical protein